MGVLQAVFLQTSAAPRFLLRDHDGIYGQDFRDRVEHMGIEEVRIAFRSPWQSPYVERLIGSIRRECFDHVIVFGEEHLCRILAEHFAYCHEARAHLSLERNSPIPRAVCPPAQGKVVTNIDRTSRYRTPAEVFWRRPVALTM